MQKQFTKKLNKKKGVSILEAMIAMAIIVAISASTITAIRVFSAGSARTFNINSAIATLQNAKEAFIYADSDSEFQQLLPVTSDSDFEQNGKVYTFEENGYSGYIMASYGTGSEKDYFSASVRDSKNNIIWEIDEFSK